jgi:hypothetical protein
VRVLGTVTQVVKEGHLDINKATQIVVWEKRLVEGS